MGGVFITCGKVRNNAELSSEELKESNHLRDLGIDGKIIRIKIYYNKI
jgi:hypothetical protein